MISSKVLCGVLFKTPFFKVLDNCQRILLLHNISRTLDSQTKYRFSPTMRWPDLQSYHSCTTQANCLRNNILKKTAILQTTTWCQFRGMAGHSKWQNIRHIKAGKDAEKSSLISKITQRIRVVIRENGNADPKFNLALARLIAEAKAKDVPNSRIDDAIKAAKLAKDTGSRITIEAKGPMGTWLVIEAFTSQVSRSRQEISSILKKHGATLGDAGFAMHSFAYKGVIEIAVDDGEKVDMDKYLDIAIEAGAEEVTLELDDYNQPYLEFVCDPKDVHTVRKALEAMELNVRFCDSIYTTENPVELVEEDLQKMSKLMLKLEEHPDVIRIFDNIVTSE